MYIRIWQFRPNSDRLSGFLKAYGPEGDWALLFRKGQGYLGTELVRSDSEPPIYLTIDRWEDAASWEAFRAAHADAYEDLDRRCEGLTLEEHEIGNFRTPETR